MPEIQSMATDKPGFCAWMLRDAASREDVILMTPKLALVIAAHLENTEKRLACLESIHGFDAS